MRALNAWELFWMKVGEQRMSGYRLEERRELFILKGKSNHSDMSRKFRHRSLELSAQRKNIVHADSPLGLLAYRQNSQRLSRDVSGLSTGEDAQTGCG